ncbi:hypothetical protein QE250_15780 [Chromatiaceae bacterium AAb-1]|nr:hypothetical protein [Chromatiaceae bacterium AAb-1]
MRSLLSALVVVALAGCQMMQPVQPEPEPVVIAEPEPEEVQLVPEPAEVPLAIADDAATLQAWIDYRVALLNNLNQERELLNGQPAADEVMALKRVLLNLHPDTPYLTRLRVQMQLSDQLATLPPGLAALFSWDILFNQKLLEAESAVSALTRLNAQQHDNLERLQQTNRELQKKIDALTQIEAQLNQPVKEDNNSNGQP